MTGIPGTLAAGLLPLLSFTILALYHAYVVMRFRRRPLSTAIGAANAVRVRWVAETMEHKRDILAVQTLRNWTMAATFLASTAILIGLGVLNLGLTAEKAQGLASTLSILGIRDQPFWLGRLLVLGGDFLFAFFNFALAVRYYNHAGFMINVSPGDGSGVVVSPESVGEVVNRGSLHYHLGMRAYYISVPLVLWLFGPLWLLLGTMGTIAVLNYVDHTV